MKILQASTLRGSRSYDVWLDEEKVVEGEPHQDLIKVGERDVEVPVQREDGAVITTITLWQYADPGYVRHFEWGADIDEATALYEMRLLCEQEMERPEQVNISRLDISKAKPSKNKESQT